MARQKVSVTVLIGGSVLLIAASAIALAFGWVTADESLIWTSIAASVGAAVLLALAFARTRGERAPPRELPAQAPPSEPRPSATVTVSGQPTASLRPETPAPAKPNAGSPDADVVAIPERRKFHRPDCRYARAKGGEKMTRSAARRRAYDPCGICKP